MDYCVWMRIPATSRRNPTNPDKIGTQPAKKNRKNQQKSIVKFLKISDPGSLRSLRNRSGTLPERARAKKTQKSDFRPQKNYLCTRFGTVFWRFSGPGREAKIDKKRVRTRKSASGEGAGSDFCRFFSPPPSGVALRTDFRTVRPSKIVLFPRRERDFDEMAVFEKTPKKQPPGTRFGTENGQKSTPGRAEIAKK